MTGRESNNHSVCEVSVDDRNAELESSELAMGRHLNERNPAWSAGPLYGVVIGKVAGLGGKRSNPLVEYSSIPGEEPVSAVNTSALPLRVGMRVALVFEMGDPLKPIIIGPVHDPGSQAAPPRDDAPIRVKKDDETLTLEAKKQIVLRCGKASITLTKSGKVILRGAYLLSRSSGVNRIQGGSVQIN